MTPFLPSPPRFGGQQRMHALISGLARHADVSILSMVDSREDQSEGIIATRAYCKEVVTVPCDRLAKRQWQLTATLSPWSYERLTTATPALQDALDRILARERYDLVQLEFAHAGALHVRTPDGSRPAICLDEHNIEYEILLRTASMASTLFRRAYNTIDGLKVRSEEQDAWSRVDGCALTSARDEETLLERAPRTRTAVVPNGVNVDYFRPAEQSIRDPMTLLFFGAIDYYPNTDAILFFLSEIMPRLVAIHPNVKLCIVGRKPPEAVLAQRGPSVDVIGAVDDLRPWLERATAIVVPLRIGGGTRLKILEAMAMGKAIVSTTLGAEGLDVVPERDLLIADDPERFAEQIARLIAAPEFATRLGEAARTIVTTHYEWKASVDRLAAFHTELIDARRLT